MVLASYAPIYNLIIFLKYPLALISYYAFYYNAPNNANSKKDI